MASWSGTALPCSRASVITPSDSSSELQKTSPVSLAGRSNSATPRRPSAERMGRPVTQEVGNQPTAAKCTTHSCAGLMPISAAASSS